MRSNGPRRRTGLGAACGPPTSTLEIPSADPDPTTTVCYCDSGHVGALACEFAVICTRRLRRPATEKRGAVGGARLMRGGGRVGASRLDGEGQVEANGLVVVQAERRRRRAEGRAWFRYRRLALVGKH